MTWRICRELLVRVCSLLNPLPTRANYIQQPATFLNEQCSFIQGKPSDFTFGDFICLRTYIICFGSLSDLRQDVYFCPW